jgi:hypothetical protein
MVIYCEARSVTRKTDDRRGGAARPNGFTGHADIIDEAKLERVLPEYAQVTGGPTPAATH